MRSRDVVTTGVVIFGIAVTAVAGLVSYRSYRYAEIQQTASKADNAASAAKLALDRVALSVRAVKAMYAADWVTPDQFVRFARTLMLSEGARSLEFDRKVTRAGRADIRKEPIGRTGAHPRHLAIRRRRQAGTAPPTGRLISCARPPTTWTAASRPSASMSPRLPRNAALISQSHQRPYDLVVSRAVALNGSTGDGVILTVPAMDRTGSIVGVATGTVTLDRAGDNRGTGQRRTRRQHRRRRRQARCGALAWRQDSAGRSDDRQQAHLRFRRADLDGHRADQYRRRSARRMAGGAGRWRRSRHDCGRSPPI